MNFEIFCHFNALENKNQNVDLIFNDKIECLNFEIIKFYRLIFPELPLPPLPPFVCERLFRNAFEEIKWLALGPSNGRFGANICCCSRASTCCWELDTEEMLDKFNAAAAAAATAADDGLWIFNLFVELTPGTRAGLDNWAPDLALARLLRIWFAAAAAAAALVVVDDEDEVVVGPGYDDDDDDGGLKNEDKYSECCLYGCLAALNSSVNGILRLNCLCQK